MSVPYPTTFPFHLVVYYSLLPVSSGFRWLTLEPVNEFSCLIGTRTQVSGSGTISAIITGIATYGSRGLVVVFKIALSDTLLLGFISVPLLAVASVQCGMSAQFVRICCLSGHCPMPRVQGHRLLCPARGVANEEGQGNTKFDRQCSVTQRVTCNCV
jgi:hypothetical protein